MSELRRDRAPEPGPIRSFDFPAIHRTSLPNGLAVVSARHGNLPVATVQLLLDAGAVAEPAQHAGLAYLTASALVAGVAGLDGAALAWEFERLGVDLETTATWDGITLEATAPADRIEPILDLLGRVVRTPTFPEGELQRLRTEQAAEILQRSKEPRALANDSVGRFTYASHVPYARPLLGYRRTVEGLTRDVISAFHGARCVPGATTLVLVGDADAERVRDLAATHLADWTGPRPATADFDPEPASQHAQIHVVDRPGAVQSEIRVAQPGIDRHHPDYFALEVMNSLLGGAFTSRLNLNLREKNGFTYGIRSAFRYRRRPGPFVIHTAVATDVTARAVEEIIREIRGLQDDGATEDEVAAARDFMSGILPLELQTTGQLAARITDLVLFGLPDDYFQHYRDGIAAVGADDVHRVASQHLAISHMGIIIVGDASAIVPPLEALGLAPVHVHPVQPD